MTDNTKDTRKPSTAGVVSSDIKKNLPYTFEETPLFFSKPTVSNGFDYNNEETTDDSVISKEDKENFYKKTLHSDIL